MGGQYSVSESTVNDQANRAAVSDLGIHNTARPPLRLSDWFAFFFDRRERFTMVTTQRNFTERMIRRREIASEIAKALMTNGNGDVAARLVLELPGGRDGGGKVERSVVDEIVCVLAEMGVGD